MSKISLSPNALGSGTLTIAAPNTNNNRTLTLPDATGIVVLDTTLPPAPAAVVNTFDSSGTWTKPASGSMVYIQVWSGGGGGARNTGTGLVTGGGGGGYNEITVPLSTLASTVAVTIGAGGAGRTGSTGDGSMGGTTTFGTLIGAIGGAGGILITQVNGGGALSADLTTDVSITLGNPFRGGLGRRIPSAATCASTYGGAGGGGADTVVYDASFCKSFLGGSGGAGSRTATAGNGQAPSGGGGGANADFNGGDGAGGRVVVTVW